MDRGGGDLGSSVLGMLHLRGQVDIQMKMGNRQFGYLKLEFREEFQAGDRDLEIIGGELLFKATGQDEITKTVAEKSICPSTARSGTVTSVGKREEKDPAKKVRRPACDLGWKPGK